MPSIDYTWLREVGFWIGIGLFQATILTFVVLIIVSKSVEYLLTFFKKADASQYAFTVLPNHYESMQLDYNAKTKMLKATAYYRNKEEYYSLSFSRFTGGHKNLANASYDTQLTLMNLISKEIDNVKTS